MQAMQTMQFMQVMQVMQVMQACTWLGSRGCGNTWVLERD